MENFVNYSVTVNTNYSLVYVENVVNLSTFDQVLDKKVQCLIALRIGAIIIVTNATNAVH